MLALEEFVDPRENLDLHSCLGTVFKERSESLAREPA